MDFHKITIFGPAGATIRGPKIDVLYDQCEFATARDSKNFFSQKNKEVCLRRTATPGDPNYFSRDPKWICDLSVGKRCSTRLS